MDENKKQQESFDELQRRKLIAEIDKIKEEKNKIEAERRQLIIQNNLKWFRSKLFLQGITAGLVAIPLIWFYIKDIAIPLYNKENIHLTYDLEIKEDSLKKAKAKYQVEVEALKMKAKLDAQKLLTNLEELRRKNLSLDSTYKIIYSAFDQLNSKYKLTEEQKHKLEQDIAKISKEIKNNKQTLQSIDTHIKQATDDVNNTNKDLNKYLQNSNNKYDKYLLPDYETSWALIIATNEFNLFPNLAFAENDGRSVANLLRTKFNFQVDEIYGKGVTVTNILDKLNYIYARIKPHDRLIIFISGHGAISPSNDGFIVPYDGDPKNLISTCMSMKEFVNLSAMIGSLHKLILLDISYSGTAIDLTKGATLMPKSSYQEPACEIITSSSSMQYAMELTKVRHGAFTYSLLDAFDGFKADFNRDKIIETNELYQFINQNVRDLTKGRQTPLLGKISGEGTMVFWE